MTGDGKNVAARRRRLVLRADPEQHLPRLRQPHAAVLQLDQPGAIRRSRTRRPPAASSLLRLDLVDYNLKNPYRVQYNASVPARAAGPHGRRRSASSGRAATVRSGTSSTTRRSRRSQADGSYFFPVGGTRRNPNFGSMRLRITDGRPGTRASSPARSRRFKQRPGAAGVLHARQVRGPRLAGGRQRRLRQQLPARLRRRSVEQQGAVGLRHPAQLRLQLDVGAAVRQGAAPASPHGLADGWQLSGILTVRSGIPFTPVLGFDRARALPRSGGAGQRPDLVSGCSLESGARRRGSVLRCRTASRCPAAGTLGNVPRNTIIGPGFGRSTSRVFKNVTFGGRPPDAAARRRVQHHEPRQLRAAGDDGLQRGGSASPTPARSPRSSARRASSSSAGRSRFCRNGFGLPAATV